MKYRFGTFLHSKFGLISFISIHPLLTFASSNGLKLLIFVTISCCHSDHSEESKNFSSFLVISFGVILIINSQFFLIIYSANHALQLNIAGPDNHRWVNKIFHSVS